MATNTTFDTMLNEYLTYDLLKEEITQRDYVLKTIEKDDGWKGGNLVVPFKAAGASSVSYGGLTAQGDISEDKFVRGGVSTYKELWGTMQFNQKDLYQHDKISEQNFLKILPDAVEDFMNLMKQAVSVNLLNGAHICKLTADSTANTGVVTVDHPDRLNIGQKVIVKDSDATTLTAYVKSIDMNALSAVLTTDRTYATPIDFSGGAGANNMTVANSAKLYNDGALSNAFSSIKDALLSAANGGSATLYGQTKTAYPYLQAINVDGSAITATNILSKIFDAFVTFRQFGKGNPNEVIVSYKHFGSILKALETSKGPYNVVAGSQKTSVYGWTEIQIGGVKGMLKVVAVQELDNDAIIFMDWRAAKFHSNGFFRKRIAPDGKQYFEVRATTGYLYLIDLSLFGELVVSRPSYCGIIANVANY